MFSLLLDKLPNSIEIDNINYKINTDFRVMILFELMMSDSEIKDDFKIINSINLFYKDIPLNLELAIEKLLWFYKCGDEYEENSTNCNKNISNINNIYDFEFDSEYIYSAFLDQYNIDLNSINHLHWWKFKAMFKSLKEDNLISKIISYRTIDLSEIKDSEERDRYKKLKEIYSLPNQNKKIENQKINEIEKMLMNCETNT